jgi:16S rRNA (adenine1518-N6/adenine1519-N6)-dimethyltransferase
MPRRLGQHFLNDPAILDRIVDALDPSSTEVVIEIGAGRGALTRRLAPRVGHVIAIEKDRILAATLRDAGGMGTGEQGTACGGRLQLPSNVTVVEGDALSLDWHDLSGIGNRVLGIGARRARRATPDSPFPIPAKIVGNIPYAITSPLIEKALTPPLPAVVVFLVQREVADRLAAAPGGKAYGALSVGVQAAARVERLFTVRAGAFRPPPKVSSAVVRLTPRDDPPVPPGRAAGFRRFVVRVFGRRRKQLGASLSGLFGLSPESVAEVLAVTGLPRTARAETLSPEGFVRLFAAVTGVGTLSRTARLR